jgi:hypothetical protein
MTQLVTIPPCFNRYVEAPHTGSHQNCTHNALDAIKRRHYSAKIPKPSESGAEHLEWAFQQLKKWCRKHGLSPHGVDKWTPQQVVDTRAACKKKAYAEAFESLAKEPLTAEDARVKVFVKFEKGPAAKLGEKPARLIQARSTRYTASLAQYLAPVEHKLYALKHNGVAVFAKSLNPKQRAAEIAAAWSPNRQYVMLDHSSFDGHMTPALLAYEHRFYLWVYGNDAELQRMLSWQLNNRCNFMGKLKWTSKGGRMSGDFNTALGNSIINCVAILAWAHQNGVYDSNFTLECDGDDSWCTIAREHTIPSVKTFAELGFTTKLEGVGSEPEDVVFCQARPVRLADGWMMCRDFRRVMSRLPYTIQHYVGSGWVRYLRGIAECEEVLSNGVPVLSALASSLLAATAGVAAIVPRAEQYSHGIAMRLKRPAVPVTPEARASYALAWDISPTEQRLLEEALSAHKWTILPG